MPQSSVILAITGASGVQYAVRLLEILLQKNNKVYLLVSKAAQVVIKMETDLDWPADTHSLQKLLCQRYGVSDQQLKICGENEWSAPIASGSARVAAMVVCPCSMGTLSAIAVGASNNLMERAADVMLKEKRKLILVPRETPFSDIHLENMLKLSRMGAVILPPSPGFYNHPQTINDVIDFVVAKILDHLSVEHALQPRWGESN